METYKTQYQTAFRKGFQVSIPIYIYWKPYRVSKWFPWKLNWKPYHKNENLKISEMSNYPFFLDTSSKKNECPNCKRKTYTYYLFSDTKEIIDKKYGRCDKENSCGYHQYPTSFLSDKKLEYHKGFQFPSLKGNGNGNPQNLPIDFLPWEIIRRSTDAYKSADLYPFLQRAFYDDIASFQMIDYKVGATKDGHTVYPQVDVYGKIRQVKIISYDGITGHRSKGVPPYFAGKKILQREEANLQQCFFGEHLLALKENDSKPVAVVESEKSCLIATVYFPQFVWLATGGKHGCRWTQDEVCKVLKDRTVILFPDLGSFDAWQEKGSKLAAAAGCKVIVSTILEKHASEADRTAGLDIADFLLRNRDSTGLAITDEGYPVMIDYYPLIAPKLNNQNSNLKYDGNTTKTIDNEIPPLGPSDRGKEIQQAISETAIENGS